jgi:hypothetical protein
MHRGWHIIVSFCARLFVRGRLRDQFGRDGNAPHNSIPKANSLLSEYRYLAPAIRCTSAALYSVAGWASIPRIPATALGAAIWRTVAALYRVTRRAAVPPVAVVAWAIVPITTIIAVRRRLRRKILRSSGGDGPDSHRADKAKRKDRFHSLHNIPSRSP